MSNVIEIRYQVGEAWKGAYDPAHEYANANVVQDRNGHSVYRSLRSGNVGHALTDKSWWFCIIDMSDIDNLNTSITAKENERVSAEQSRNTAEQGRETAEALRVTAEEARETAEGNRATAETSRSNAEASRVTEEAARETAEASRVTAEGDRATAETTRNGSEYARELAETERQVNENNRSAAEAGRVSQAASDHQQASNDHNTASSDHTTAVSDHNTASSDHTTAGTDHENAAADHQQAGEDHAQYLLDHASIADKADKDLDAVEGNVAMFDDKGNVVDANVAVRELARNNGYYEEMTVGTAENLVGRGVAKAMYTHRTSGGNADIGTGAAEIETINGNTVVFNQLINLTKSKTVRGPISSYFGRIATDLRYNVISGHKYFMSLIAETSETLTNNSVTVLFGGNNSSQSSGLAISVPKNFSGRRDGIVTASSSATRTSLNWNNGSNGDGGFASGEYLTVSNVMLIDLTMMFGAGNEPSTANEFSVMYPLYYNYTTGVLANSKPLGIETVGFNLYNPATGTAELLGYQTYGYQITGSYTSLSFTDVVGVTSSVTPDENGLFNVSRNGTLTITGGNATDTCVHIVWSGYRNGEYEDYIKRTMYFIDSEHDLSTLTGKLNGEGASVQMFPDGLRSVGSVHDYIKGGYGHVLVGSQSVTGAAGDTVTLVGCDESATEYIAVSYIGTLSGGVLTLSAAASSVTVLYPLATQLKYKLDQDINMFYFVDDFGTEKRLAEDTASSVQAPMLYDVNYAMNAVDTLRRLPENYISEQSMDAFMSALSSALGTALDSIVTMTKTWSEENGRYNFSIEITPNEQSS